MVRMGVQQFIKTAVAALCSTFEELNRSLTEFREGAATEGGPYSMFPEATRSV